jgi:hypothetical protein
MRDLVTRRFRLPLPRRCRCRNLRPKEEDPCITELFDAQARALYEIGACRGLLGPIGVGHGKTLLDLLAPLALGARLVLLLVPAGLRNQLASEYELVREHWKVPNLTVHGKGIVFNAGSQTSLHAMSYDSLSRPESTTFLLDLEPEAIIADEVHQIASDKSTRAGRLLDYFKARPNTRFVCWTGTMMKKSILDFSTLAAMALRENSPLPINHQVAQEWAAAVDPGRERVGPGALEKLCAPGEDPRSGLHRRLVQTLGVVSTTDPPVRSALVVTERRPPEVPGEVEDALRRVRDLQERPDHELLLTPLDVAKCAREIAAGFYYVWRYPRGEPEWLREQWFRARRAWFSAVRDQLADRRPHLDSPALLARAAMRGWGDVEDEEGPTWAHPAWPAWRDVKDEVEPVTVGVRLHPFLAEDAADWALKHRGVVWYDNREFGSWVAELSGLPRFGGGDDAARELVREGGDRSVIASINSHGTGRNGMQTIWSEQLVAQAPIKQTAAEVRTWVYTHTPEYQAAMRVALDRGECIGQIIGQHQKLASTK